LNCSASAYAALAASILSRKVSQQYVSQLSAATKEFDSDKEKKEFFQIIDTMNHLQETISPRLPIAWSDVLGVQDVLARTFEQRKNEIDPLHRQVWVVRLSLHDYFKGLRLDGSVITTLNYYNGEAAAFAADSKLAGECVELLKARNVPAKAELFTVARRQSTITTSLEEMGFESAAIGGTDEQATEA